MPVSSKQKFQGDGFLGAVAVKGSPATSTYLVLCTRWVAIHGSVLAVSPGGRDQKQPLQHISRENPWN